MIANSNEAMSPCRRYWALLLFLGVFAAAFGCKRESPPSGAQSSGKPALDKTSASSPPSSGDPVVVQIAYGSEKKSWLTDAISRFNASKPRLSTGEALKIEGTAIGSGSAVEDLVDGTTRVHAWLPASSMYRELLNRAWSKQQGAIGGSQEIATLGKPIALSPIVIAMWKPMAQALGWPDNAIGWADILAISRNPKGWSSKGHPEWGTFKFGHTHPMMSNSGTLAVLAEAYAALGETRGLTIDSLRKPTVPKFIESIEESIVHYGKSTGFFSDRMLQRGPSFLSAAVLYENLVVDSYQLPEYKNRDLDLVCIYPKEGTFWIDNPYYVLDVPWSDTAHKRGAEQFRDFVLAADEQRIAMERFGFRPADPKIAISAPLDMQHGVDPKQPQTLLDIPPSDVVDAALSLWTKYKKTVDIAFVFDRSGSMKGDPLQKAKQGASDFLAQLNERDRVSLMMFNHEVPRPSEPSALATSRDQLKETIQGAFADGGTALYDSIIAAYRTLNEFAKRNPKRIYAVVVLTDGKDENSESTLEATKAAVTPASEAAQASVRLFTIAYGSGADKQLLGQLAELGGGASFAGDTATIRQVYRDLAAFF